MQPRRTIARLSVVLCLFAVHLRAQDLATTAAIYRPKLGQNLKDNIAGFWYPKTVDRIAPNENKEVQALVTPAAKAVAGDYVTSVRASARGESASQSFRVAVTTSTIWGIVGIALIGGALLVMIGAVVWFGRR